MRPLRFLLALGLVLLAGGVAQPQSEPNATAIRAVHRNGQTFVTWMDAAPAEAGARYRYALYRADVPITEGNLADARLVGRGILNNSARRFGEAFRPQERLDLDRPQTILEEGGAPLPLWSGVGVYTARAAGRGYYAVVTTDGNHKALSRVVPGTNATTAPVEEQPGELRPIKQLDSGARGSSGEQGVISGTAGLPLHLWLHPSASEGGPAGRIGDYYVYFGSEDMGLRDGMPGIFSVEERREKGGGALVVKPRDAIEIDSPRGGAHQSLWFGYYLVPQWSTQREPRAYPFTERRLLWVLDWTQQRYQTDPERVYVSGQSMGGWGTATFALRHPERFAAVFPLLPRFRQHLVPGLATTKRGQRPLMDDGKTPYFERMDMVRFVGEHRADLPFIGWAIGRRDGFATFEQQVEMVKALTAARHGFAFAWNNGGHSAGTKPIAEVYKYYPPDRFRRNLSYPAFTRSSIDDDPGDGDPSGVMEGRINLGLWEGPHRRAHRWGRSLLERAHEPAAVVAPRRSRKFRPRPMRLRDHRRGRERRGHRRPVGAGDGREDRDPSRTGHRRHVHPPLTCRPEGPAPWSSIRGNSRCSSRWCTCSISSFPRAGSRTSSCSAPATTSTPLGTGASWGS